LFLLEHYQRDRSAIAAMNMRGPKAIAGENGSSLFPGMVLRRPGYVHVLKIRLIEFLPIFIKNLVALPTIRNEKTVRDWDYWVLDDAVYGAMIHTMMTLANEKSECSFNMTKLEISLLKEGRAGRPTQIDSDRASQLMQQEGSDGDERGAVSVRSRRTGQLVPP
jgi:hypothetical protein